MTRDEFVRFSRFAFGADWPDRTAQVLKMERRELVRQINETDAVPDDMSGVIADLANRKIRELQAELERVCARTVPTQAGDPQKPGRGLRQDGRVA